jgi:hypothetical protein
MGKKAQPQSSEPVEHKVMLQIRVLYQDQNGRIRDVTQDDKEDRGLKNLQQMSAGASDGLRRTKELLQLLALAVEKREQVAAALVQRVLEEVETAIEDCSDLGSYVHFTEKLFEEAEALPFIAGIVSSPVLLKHAS